METLMTLEEAAAYVRPRRDTVYRMAPAGKIPASKVGNPWCFQEGRRGCVAGEEQERREQQGFEW